MHAVVVFCLGCGVSSFLHSFHSFIILPRLLLIVSPTDNLLPDSVFFVSYPLVTKSLAGDAACGPPVHHLHFIPSSFYGTIPWSWYCGSNLSWTSPIVVILPLGILKPSHPITFLIVPHLFPYPERPQRDPRTDAKYCQRPRDEWFVSACICIL